MTHASAQLVVVATQLAVVATIFAKMHVAVKRSSAVHRQHQRQHQLLTFIPCLWCQRTFVNGRGIMFKDLTHIKTIKN